MTDDVDHITSLTSLFHLLLHANDTTIEFINNDKQNFVIVVDQILIDYLIENLNRFFNVAKATRYLFFINLCFRALDEMLYKNASINFMILITTMLARFHFANALSHFNAN